MTSEETPAEEKAEVQLQDFLKMAPGYVNRILDHTLASGKLLDELNCLPQEIVDRGRRAIASQMGQALDLTDKSDPLIPALEILAEPDWSEMLAAVKRCRSEYKKTREGAQKEGRGRILRSLAAKGIRGSAVAAKIEGDPSWEAEDRELRRPCEESLEALRSALG